MSNQCISKSKARNITYIIECIVASKCNKLSVNDIGFNLTGRVLKKSEQTSVSQFPTSLYHADTTSIIDAMLPLNFVGTLSTTRESISFLLLGKSLFLMKIWIIENSCRICDWLFLLFSSPCTFSLYHESTSKYFIQRNTLIVSFIVVLLFQAPFPTNCSLQLALNLNSIKPHSYHCHKPLNI